MFLPPKNSGLAKSRPNSGHLYIIARNQICEILLSILNKADKVFRDISDQVTIFITSYDEG